MMKKLFVVCIAALVVLGAMQEAEGRNPRGGLNSSVVACPSSGTMVPSMTSPRLAGISPFVAFFDASGTTDSATLGGANNTFQDIYYSWAFGDTAASGTGTWATGANAGINSMNVAYGGVTAHMYQVADGAGDQTYTVTLTPFDGTNSSTCTLHVTVYDPIGANGFTTTICYFNTTLGSGCPSGATQTTSSVIVGGNLSGKRLLYKCGDTFTSAGVTISGTKGQIGAYGGCQGTQTSRPIFQATTAVDGLLNLNNPSADIRITDIDLDGNSQAGVAMLDNNNGGTINGGNKLIQYTLYNVNARNQAESYRWSAGGQMAIVSSTAQAVQTASPWINVFPNYAGVGNGGGTCTACLWTASGPSEDFLFVSGNMFTDGVSGNSELETMRDSYASKHVISNNSFLNAGLPSFALLKLHNLNFATNGGTGAWSGIYSQYIVVSDNLFQGSSGSQCLEISPQNPQSDERLRYLVIERNLMKCTESIGRQTLFSGVNASIRDNTYITASGSASIQIAQRGFEPPPQFVEVYNNTMSGGGSVGAIQFNNVGQSGTVNVANSFAQNNLFFGAAVVANSGSGNTVTSNTTTTTNNPGFTNGSGSFSLISDFKPTANFSGGTSVPDWYDALQVPWSPTWDLGAVHH